MSLKSPARVEPVIITVLTRPLSARHWMLTGAAFAGLALLFILLAWSVARYPLSPALVSLLSENVFDEDTHTYARILDPGFSQAEVVILGSSNVDQALLDSRELTGKYMSVNPAAGRIEKVASAGQTFLDALFLISEANLRPGQTVIVHVAPSTFSRGFDRERLVRGVYLQPSLGVALRHAGEIDQLGELLEPRRRLAAGVSSTRQLLRRLLANLPGNYVRSRVYRLPLQFTIDQRPNDARGPDADRVPDAIVATRRQVAAMLDENFSANLAYNIQVLEALLDLLEEKGLKAVLMETAIMDGDVEGYLAPYWPRYRSVVASVAQKHDVPWVDLNREVQLDTGDFLDARHTSSSGRRKWSGAFINWLSEAR